MRGAADNGMALIRPMGHTAGADSTEGGSYFNNAAVAARAAQRAGARRVLIVDWCVGVVSVGLLAIVWVGPFPYLLVLLHSFFLLFLLFVPCVL